MKKTICGILALFILTQLNCYSQEITRTSIKIDRIKQILERTESDTVRILQLQNWSDIIFYSNPDLHLKLQTDIVNLCEDNLLNPSNEKEKKWFFLIISVICPFLTLSKTDLPGPYIPGSLKM